MTSRPSRHGGYSIIARFAYLSALILSIESSHALPTDREQPLKIRADSAIRDEALGETRYVGDVELQQGSLVIKADLLTINHAGNTANVVVAEGDPAILSQLPEADGRPVTAQARQIEYYRVEDKIILRDGARIEQDGAIVTGAIIDYLIEAQKVSATSAESDNKNSAAKRRVEVTIPPAVLAPDAK
ncbi:MAG: lipopolysaccharide transport periplasmic protein LptA [Halieaceae bacterium]|jgi:lipopolysaccharide export system protein LptA